MKFDFPKFFASLALPFVASAVGSYFTAPAITMWYQALAKPSFNPPGYVFGPVWTLLYLMMGIALYLVWNTPVKKNKTDGKAKKDALTYFYVQLGLNTLWSIVFFGMRNPELALVVILILWMAILWTIQKFYKFSIIGGNLLIPYLLWVSFATVLNYFIVILN